MVVEDGGTISHSVEKDYTVAGVGNDGKLILTHHLIEADAKIELEGEIENNDVKGTFTSDNKDKYGEKGQFELKLTMQ